MERCICHGVRLIMCPNRNPSAQSEANRVRVRAELDRADVLERGKRFGSR